MRSFSLLCCQNQLNWRYALADSWFSSSENMKYIHATLEKLFIFALKSNRLIALNKEDKAKGRYTRFMSQNWVGFLTHSKATGKLVSFE
jgi:hypothetical protein